MNGVLWMVEIQNNKYTRKCMFNKAHTVSIEWECAPSNRLRSHSFERKFSQIANKHSPMALKNQSNSMKFTRIAWLLTNKPISLIGWKRRDLKICAKKQTHTVRPHISHRDAILKDFDDRIDHQFQPWNFYIINFGFWTLFFRGHLYKLTEDHFLGAFLLFR